MATYVYLAKANGLYKIGMSTDLSERLRVLRGKYSDMQCLWLIATKDQRQGQCLERAIHILFAEKHVCPSFLPLGKEWFALTSADIERFKTIQRSDLVDVNFAFTHLSPNEVQ